MKFLFRIMKSSWILLLIFTSLSSVIKCVYIEENGYKDVVISFSKNVVEEPELDFYKLKDILINASDILFYATRKRSYFENFLFVVPPTWIEKGLCDEFIEKAPKNIDIYVTDSSAISVLTTQHSKGCGEKGEIIYLPKNWMKGSTRELALQFVQQWSTFRYGVFSENPERPGSCIASIDSTWSPAGCYNIDLNMEVRFNENELPLCYLPNNFSEQEDLQSSIMFSDANSSEILNFCDGSDAFPHNPISPTLHNRICGGNSVWSVIKKTEDFKYGRNSTMKDTNSPKKPTFRCFKESKTHLTIMVQDTYSEAKSEIRYSLSYFLSIIEPTDFAVSLGTFSSEINTDDNDFINITLQDKENLKSLLDSWLMLNKKVPDVCLTCGLRKAYKVSETSQYSLRTIVLIARESSLENMKISDVTEIMQKEENAVLHVLFLGDTATDIISSSLIEVIQNNGGRIYRLKNEPVFMLSELTTALLDVSKNNLHIEDKILVVHKKVYVNVTSNFNDVFWTPKRTKGKLLYSMQFEKRGDIKAANKCRDMDPSLPSPICGNELDISDESASAKVWEYPFLYDAGNDGATCSSLALFKLDSSSKTSFTLKGWLSENKIIPGENALVIYAEVYNRLDHDIKIEARISGPGLEDFRLELRDNGNGDPDIIKGDSIYSRYFTSFSEKGTYTVSIIAEDLGTQNDFKNNPTKDAVKVSQTKVIGTFRVIRAPPKEDILPPNRVCDLEVISINSTNRTISIQWTAPGDDYDYGKANEYKMYFTEDWKDLDEDLLNKILIKTFNMSKIEPQMNGKQEIEMFSLPKSHLPKIYFIALKTTDKNGNEGKISNIVQAAILLDNLLINNLTQYNDTENNTESVMNYHKDGAGLSYTNIYIISGVVLGIIFIIIVINILIWISCFRKYKKSLKATKSEYQHDGKKGSNINSDENILQSENENGQIKRFMQNDDNLNQNADTTNPMLLYTKVQKRGKNQDSTITYINESFKQQETSEHKENDLGFV